MTREEKQKVIDALKISVPATAVTQEEFDTYIQTLNKVAERLEQEFCEDAVSRKHLLSEIDELMQSPWFNNGKNDDTIMHYGYVERKEAVEIVRDLCVKTEPPVTSKPYDEVLNKIKAEFKSKADGDDWYHTTDGLVWEEAIEIIDKYMD